MGKKRIIFDRVVSGEFKLILSYKQLKLKLKEFKGAKIVTAKKFLDDVEK